MQTIRKKPGPRSYYPDCVSGFALEKGADLTDLDINVALRGTGARSNPWISVLMFKGQPCKP